MKELSLFDVIGPKMIGPSSSHTAGAVRIARMAREFIKGDIVKAVFVLYGSFAETYQGHGTDRALVGGILGFDTSDVRIRESFLLAKEQGIEISFVTDKHTETDHANTVEIRLTSASGEEIDTVGVSLGGGEVEIRALNGVEVQFRGEYHTLLVLHQDRPGVVANITQQLSVAQINIAFMKLFRQGKGDRAYTIIETDDSIQSLVIENIRQQPNVFDAILIQG